MFNLKKGGVMPNFNGTGPEGKGSRTGRGLGKCKPSDSGKSNKNENENISRFGRRLRFWNRQENIGGGRGQGRRNRFRGDEDC